jgi:hypothetical protein
MCCSAATQTRLSATSVGTVYLTCYDNTSCCIVFSLIILSVAVADELEVESVRTSYVRQHDTEAAIGVHVMCSLLS